MVLSNVLYVKCECFVYQMHLLSSTFNASIGQEACHTATDGHEDIDCMFLDFLSLEFAYVTDDDVDYSCKLTLVFIPNFDPMFIITFSCPQSDRVHFDGLMNKFASAGIKFQGLQKVHYACSCVDTQWFLSVKSAA